MDNDTDKLLEFYKQESKNYFNAVIVISGGLCGLLLLKAITIKVLALLIIGIWFDCLCIIRHIDYNKSILKLIRGVK